MLLKTSVTAIALFQAAGLVQAATSKLSSSTDYWKSFTTAVDPTNITIPSISQTTSNDPTKECVYYDTPTALNFNESEWPTIWDTATSNGMNTSAEFLSLYNSIDWTSSPNISVRTLNSDGSIDMTGYDEDSDPDCWWSASTCTVPKIKDVNEDIYACPEPDTWGLTYDDGPNCSHNAFYDYLQEQELKATMFYIGSNVLDWPYGAMRGIKDGHHIADHTWSHQLMTTLTNQEVLAELYYTQKAIKLVTGVTPLYWRPAFGDVDDRVRWIATQLNLTTILWNLDTNDWAAGDTETVEDVQTTYSDFIEMGSNGTFATSGQIVLTHEIDNTTMSLAVENIPKIKAAYKNVLDVATCMNITYPYQEKTISFAAFGGSAVSNTTSSASSASSAVSGASSSSGTTSAIAAAAASASSAGVQVSPNAAVLAVLAIAAYLF
ncbi:carbohydrate esterase family 4 protein [Backusella circina FSU 941]|nr:carbohydrate esterase family 4 protein [Backusella circina FSU 941]